MVSERAAVLSLLFSDYGFVLVSVFIFFAGLIFGSFFNVVIHRLPKGISIVFPPSSCPSCSAKIKYYDNIPVISFIFLRGRCRKCGAGISFIYPLVEIITGLLFLFLFLKYFYQYFLIFKISPDIFYLFPIKALYYNLILFISGLIFISILIPIIFIDLYQRIIPDFLNIFLIASGFIINFFALGRPFLFPLLGFLIPGLFFYLIAVFYRLVKKKEGLGGGDVKLIAGIGAYIGLKGAVFSIFGGSVLALAGFAFYVLFGKIRKDGISAGDFKIPFGPFLSGAAILYIFYGNLIFDFYIRLLGGR